MYLSELRRLVTLFAGLNDKALTSAFVSGLPEEVRQLLRPGSPMEDLELYQILTRKREVVKDDTACASSETSLGAMVRHGIGQCTAVTHQRCFVCDGLNHLTRHCFARRQNDTSGGAGSSGSRRPRRSVRCYYCDGLGNFASACSGNERGEASLFSRQSMNVELPSALARVGDMQQRVLVEHPARLLVRGVDKGRHQHGHCEWGDVAV